ncbi:hypothetical protein ACUNWD_10390 [Sunxiuqinia sp. A32]|uniref:hypothetical protein n=1 Tax=Sunxiuqinia sp. A32 TaxID=3461496 RepID=UPI0040465014
MKINHQKEIKLWIILVAILLSVTSAFSQPLWETMKNEKDVLKLSVWFRAQDVDQYLANKDGLNSAISWCKKYGITKVYLEAYGRGLYANRETLLNSKERFLNEGFEVASGATTEYGPDEFDIFHCYTHKRHQEELQRISEYAASLFDEVILDDWYFTNCECADCIHARGDQSWSKYYTDLMLKMSEERVLKPARAVNPNVKMIIKYPQWNDEYHTRGYDVVRESKVFDGIWVGTEGRQFDYEKSEGYEIGYNAYFNMRWLANFGSIGGAWFDTGRARTKIPTYLEQARHTILGEGDEVILWCYGGHLEATPKIEALSEELPGLIKLANLVQGKPIKGVQLLKPGNSDSFEETWVCSFLGELGIPFVPVSDVDEEAMAVVFPVQSLKDPGFIRKFQHVADRGTPILVTDGLAKRMTANPAYLNNVNVKTLPVKGSPKALLNMTREEIKTYRDHLLAPFGMKFDAPARVELYLFGENMFVVENINDEAVDVTLELPKVSTVNKALILPESGSSAEVSLSGKTVKMTISAHTLVAVGVK